MPPNDPDEDSLIPMQLNLCSRPSRLFAVSFRYSVQTILTSCLQIA
jgi:hypothetical protein